MKGNDLERLLQGGAPTVYRGETTPLMTGRGPHCTVYRYPGDISFFGCTCDHQEYDMVRFRVPKPNPTIIIRIPTKNNQDDDCHGN